MRLQEITINLNGRQITAQHQLSQTAASILKPLQPSEHHSVMSQALSSPFSTLNYTIPADSEAFSPF